MTYRTAGRALFLATALMVAVGLAFQLEVAITADEADTFFDTTPARVFNVFCFFTIQSNVIVGLTCLLLALDPQRDSTLFRLFRLAGVVDIVITGIVYHVAISSLHEFTGNAAVADQILHTVVPIMGLVGWLVFGPRGLATRADVARSALVPVAWLIFTLIRGPIVDWYPYEFMQVPQHGYPRVFFNMLLVFVLFVVLALGAAALDRRLGPGRRQPTAAEPMAPTPAAG